jgi:3-deoxy-manno-octulosonate cytidylyltransferase (CMP-KDO synthetase)
VPRPQSSTAEREAPSRPRIGAVAVIPARLQSTRLPEKALQDLGGAPLVVRVLERARLAVSLGAICVATDSERIAAAVTAAGGTAVMTRSDHPSGLDRVAEAAAALARDRAPSPEDVIVNIQGDEPFLHPAGIDHMTRLFERPEVRMATLAAPFYDPSEVADPSRVKVVVDRASRALYFSRAPVPWGAGTDVKPLLHVGLYAYRRATLEALAALPPSPLELAERLEQLRALWNGIPIDVAVGDYHSLGIDTPEDLARARDRWGERRNSS